MYTLLTGAKKNVGDFLIVENCKELLKTHSKEEEFLEFKRWESLDDKLDEINKTKAIILCGGPGYARNFYPGIFPLVKDINKIKVPIIPFALGWCGQPINNPDKFSFDDSSIFLLKHIHKNCEVTSCRDNITKAILNRHGFKNVIMTGCSAWYDLDSIGKRFEPPRDIRQVAISMAQNPIFHNQNIELLQEVKKLLKPLYPKIELYAVFHRGLKQDKFTSKREANCLKKLKRMTEESGYKIINAAYDVSKMEVYRDCDLHIGYRIHAHIFRLSVRKPSFLLWEDGRGRGLSETLGLPDVTAVNRFFPLVLSSRYTRILYKLGISDFVVLNRRAIRTIVNDIKKELLNGFPRFQEIDKILDGYYKNMLSFLKTLP